MKIRTHRPVAPEQGSILAYFIVALVLLTAVAGVTAYVSQTLNVTHRRDDMVRALQFAEGGAAIACGDLDRAFTNTGSLGANLANNASGAYALNTSLSAGATNVYERTISAPFTDQSVIARIWLPKSNSITSAKVTGTATVGKVTQMAATHLLMGFAYPGAIISDNPGTTGTGTDKGTAQDGNVSINGDKNGPLVVDGGDGWAVLANGRANVDAAYATIATNSISMTNFGTANQVPDYTAEGSTDQLFDFKRFIAVADLTPNGASVRGNNHFTNMTEFITAQKGYNRNKPMEGVVVVNLNKNDMKNDIDSKDFPNGINIRGTLVFNFASDVGPWDKIINTADMNINAADLSGLVPGNPATYPTGYPPVFSDSTKSPYTIDITSRTDTSGKPFQNFVPGDDMPAVMYSIGILDMHGNVNISGVVYTPSFMEIENKADGQIQYFKGSLIAGNGVYVENTHKSTTIVSYDGTTLDYLATEAGKLKRVLAVFWE